MRLSLSHSILRANPSHLYQCGHLYRVTKVKCLAPSSVSAEGWGQLSSLLEVARSEGEAIFPSPSPPQGRWRMKSCLSQYHDFRAGSPVPSPGGSHGIHVRCRAHFPEFYSWCDAMPAQHFSSGPALPPAIIPCGK